MTVTQQIEAEKNLRDVLRDYAGQWVALQDYSVVAASDDLEGLLEQIEGQREDATVLHVAEDENVACFF